MIIDPVWFFSDYAQFLSKEHLIPTPVCTGIQGLAYMFQAGFELGSSSDDLLEFDHTF